MHKKIEYIEQLLDDETKGKYYTLMMGDFNAVVGVKNGKAERKDGIPEERLTF